MGGAALSKNQDAAEAQLNSCLGAQPIQSGAPSRHEASLQAETLCCLGRVARSRGIDRRSRDGGRASTSPRYFDTAVTTSRVERREDLEVRFRSDGGRSLPRPKRLLSENAERTAGYEV